MRRDSALVIRLWGWTLRIDGYGLSLFDTHRFESDAEAAELAADEAGHDCRRDHPDGPCDVDDIGACRESDLEHLLWRARNGDDPVELMAEFYAGVRADPERPS